MEKPNGRIAIAPGNRILRFSNMDDSCDYDGWVRALSFSYYTGYGMGNGYTAEKFYAWASMVMVF